MKSNSSKHKNKLKLNYKNSVHSIPALHHKKLMKNQRNYQILRVAMKCLKDKKRPGFKIKRNK